MNIRTIKFKGFHHSDGVGFIGLNPADAGQMVDFYDGLAPYDLSSNGLPVINLQHYSSKDKARVRLDDLERSRYGARPVGAYAVLDCTKYTDEGNWPVMGTATFAGPDLPNFDKIRDFVLGRDPGVRDLTSMLLPDRIEGIDPYKIMRGCVEVAQKSGLVALRAAVVSLEDEPSDKVVVLEHAVDLKDFGFKEVGEKEVRIEEVTYPSTVYELSF